MLPLTRKVGKVIKWHNELLRLANIDAWELPIEEQSRPLRDAAYVMSP